MLIPAERAWRAREVSSPVDRLIVATCPGQVPDSVAAVLHPAELAFVMAERSGDSFREWVAGRYCLTVALKPIAPRTPVLVRRSGAPAMPNGLSGSISHKGCMTAAVASTEFEGIGVDLERVDEGDRDLQGKVLTRSERIRLAQLGDLRSLYVTMHFSLKEAAYKAALPDDQEDMEFQDVELTMPQTALTRQLAWTNVPIEVAHSRFRYDGHIFRQGRWMLAAATRSRR